MRYGVHYVPVRESCKIHRTLPNIVPVSGKVSLRLAWQPSASVIKGIYKGKRALLLSNLHTVINC
jgi:hypothetical protein